MPLRDSRYADLLTIGFGATVVMWAIGYVCRLPPVVVPAPLLVAALLVCLGGAGYVTVRSTSRGVLGGAMAGTLASLLNILILGSLLSGEEPNRVAPSAWISIPGALVAGGVLGGLGALAGRLGPRRTAVDGSNWIGAFARVGAAATFCLLVIGGVVTSKGAGLAVVDWPNSFGYNMFLYPLSRMSGGIYYEHSHRLFGSLVGLTTLVLFALVVWHDCRRWMKWLSGGALALVIVQGILGGLRVTGRFTLSTSPEEVAPNLALAVVHGVVGQIFFGLMVALGVFTSRTWTGGVAGVGRRSAGSDRALNVALVVLLVVQLVLGALQRHFMRGLQIHITLGILVAVLAVGCGVRAWGLYPDRPILPRVGKYLLVGICLQVLLGIGALITVGVYPASSEPPWIQVLVTTAHQAVGALLLACAVLLALWSYRLVRPVDGLAGART